MYVNIQSLISAYVLAAAWNCIQAVQSASGNQSSGCVRGWGHGELRQQAVSYCGSFHGRGFGRE